MTCGSLRLGGFLIAAALVGLVAAAPPPGKESATATPAGPKGESIGEAVLTETPHGVLVTAMLHDLTPGPHGFHIHDHGECTAPFTSAGGHVHAGRDDYRSDPAGNSGDRVACGVIDVRATEPTAAAARARPSKP